MKEGQVTDRYTAAVNNLGDDKMHVRLGGVYALQRIMQDSARDQPSIANVLSTYVRVARPPVKGHGVSTDVQAALNVLTTRDTTDDEDFHLDLSNAKLPRAGIGGAAPDELVPLSMARLSGTDLFKADLSFTDLSYADLSGANLRMADLTGADLTGADLPEADLRGANLGDVNLDGADLNSADMRDMNLRSMDLEYVRLHGADLRGADLAHATLLFADLRGADLRGAKNLTEQQLFRAYTDETTKLPARFR